MRRILHYAWAPLLLALAIWLGPLISYTEWPKYTQLSMRFLAAIAFVVGVVGCAFILKERIERSDKQ